MKVLIAGIDGYLGWSLARWLTERDDVEVHGVDGLMRREWVEEVGSASAVPIATLPDRAAALERRSGGPVPFWIGDLRDPGFASEVVRAVEPDAVVHLAECPSAPYSMMDPDHCRFVQTNNLLTTMNLMFALVAEGASAHMVKLGTMGEYGTPGVPIPEGSGWLTHEGETAYMPFPRQAGSWYHWSKVHGSNNLSFACRLSGLRVTDVMQGVVFGVYPSDGDDARLDTRCDVDAVFGTVIHRWCAQAVLGAPLTVYGAGGQRRGFIALEDSMRCLQLLLHNPPDAGEYRVVNQLDDVHRLDALVERVAAAARLHGLAAQIEHVPNPRLEEEDHRYDVASDILPSLGYRSRHAMDADLGAILSKLMTTGDRLHALEGVLHPDVSWVGGRRGRPEVVEA